MTTDPLALEARAGLPDALRVLAAEYPRDVWTGHHNFNGLTRFWMSRHIEFRRALAMMQADTRQALDKDGDMGELAHRTGRVGDFFVEALHGHHHIEDVHYFPKLAALDNRLARGFDILDTDHHELDRHLDALEARLTTLGQARSLDQQHEVFGTLEKSLTAFGTFLDRHLTDEEELIVPIILHYGAESL